MVELLALVVVFGFATYRVTRLAIEDTLFAGPRARVHAWLLRPRPTSLRRAAAGRWAFKLVSCGWCLSVWISGALIAGSIAWTDLSVPVPFVTWMATAGAGVAIWQRAEP